MARDAVINPMRYRDAIRNACIELGKGGLFRSKSSESQNAVDAIAVAMRDDTDELLSELVNWPCEDEPLRPDTRPSGAGSTQPIQVPAVPGALLRGRHAAHDW